MAEYYVDSAGSNTSPYDNWTKAAQNIQTIIDIPYAGDDIVYARGTLALAGGGTIDFDQANGSATSRIRLVGCAADGSVEGTQYTIDGTNLNANEHIATIQNDYLWFENFKFTTTPAGTGCCLDASVASIDANTFINCDFCNSSEHGISASGGTADLWLLIGCNIYNNAATSIG